LTFEELVRQSGLDEELVRLATDTGLVRPLRTSAGGADDAPDTASGAADGEGAMAGTLYSAGALTMLRAATELLAAEMPLDDLIGLALRHASNMEAVAADAVGLFADRFADVPTAQRADLAARLIPLVTVLGLQASLAVGGAIIVETIFQLPGMGKLVIDSIFFQEVPTAQALTLLIAAGVALISLLVDISYAFLDPRIRYT